MKLDISYDDGRNGMGVDRDGVLNDHGRQGFSVTVGGLQIHFEDELDAAGMAVKICLRLGITVQAAQENRPDECSTVTLPDAS